MLNGNYFKAISIIYGLAMVLKGPMVHLIPERWQRFENDRFYSDKYQRWYWLAGSIGFFIVVYTWYRHFTADIEHSWIISAALTILQIKLTQVVLNCDALHKLSQNDTIECIWRIATTNVFLTLGGAVLLYLGIFIY